MSVYPLTVPSAISMLPKSTTDAANIPSPVRPSAVNVARNSESPSATEERLLVEGNCSVAVKPSNEGNSKPA